MIAGQFFIRRPLTDPMCKNQIMFWKMTSTSDPTTFRRVSTFTYLTTSLYHGNKKVIPRRSIPPRKWTHSADSVTIPERGTVSARNTCHKGESSLTGNRWRCQSLHSAAQRFSEICEDFSSTLSKAGLQGVCIYRGIKMTGGCGFSRRRTNAELRQSCFI